jgi:hypothetical protein
MWCLVAENFGNHLVHLVISVNKFLLVYSFFFFSFQPLHPSTFLLVYEAHSQCYVQTASFRITQHVGYRRIRLQLNYCAKILNCLGNPAILWCNKLHNNIDRLGAALRFVGVCSFQLPVGRFGILVKHKAVFPWNCDGTVCCQVADLNYIKAQFGTLWYKLFCLIL